MKSSPWRRQQAYDRYAKKEWLWTILSGVPTKSFTRVKKVIYFLLCNANGVDYGKMPTKMGSWIVPRELWAWFFLVRENCAGWYVWMWWYELFMTGWYNDVRIYGCLDLGYNAMNDEEVFCLDCKAFDLWRVGCILHDFPPSDFLILLEDESDADLWMP